MNRITADHISVDNPVMSSAVETSRQINFAFCPGILRVRSE